ncbi:MAG: hypothetical protein HY841_01005 [Bacteroidetes bacterium]|nr:hypothetical protein [Bacteroidota bacterium]
MNDFFPTIKMLHLFFASCWLGEVMVINFIMTPALGKYNKEGKSEMLVTIFPKLFRMASILSAITIITGTSLLWFYTKFNFEILMQGHWRIILIGGTLGLLLTLFHFFLEARVTNLLAPNEKNYNYENHALVYGRLKIIPRIGLVVITTIFFLMMFAEYGI